MGGLSLMVYVLASTEQQLPKDLANGSYASSCCGVMVLRDGEMHVGNAVVPYAIEADKVGAYILPARFVGEGKGDYLVDGGSAPLKLRLDDAVRPTRIALDRGHTAALFEM
jgi:hypothetical protein